MSYSVNTYSSYPTVTLTWSNTDLNYVIIKYYVGTVTGTPISSGNQYGTSWTTGNLLFNTTYIFFITPYSSTGKSGNTKQLTITTNPQISGTYSLDTLSTTSSVQLQWVGQSYYSRIYRKIISPYITDYVEVSANALIYTSPFYDNDISGNTTYNYKIQSYDYNNNILSSSNTMTVYTVSHPPTNLKIIFSDTSAITISFNYPKNSYSTSYYYELVGNSNGIITTISGQSNILTLKNLNIGSKYNCYINTYLDRSLKSTTTTLLTSTILMKSWDYYIGTSTSSTLFGSTAISVSVDAAKQKMLFTDRGGSLIYAVNTNNTWIVKNTLYSNLGLVGTTNTASCVQLSSNGMYGVVVSGKGSSLSYAGLIDWTGSIPTITKITDSNFTYSYSWFYDIVQDKNASGIISCAISNDGTLITIGTSNGLYFCKYPLWTLTLANTDSIVGGMTISPDKSIVVYSNYNDNYSLTYATWNGSTFSSGKLVINKDINKDNICYPTSLCFLGGGYSGIPSYLFLYTYTAASGTFFGSDNTGYICKWNHTNKSIDNIQNTLSFPGAHPLISSNCSDGLTFYYGANNNNINYTKIVNYTMQTINSVNNFGSKKVAYTDFSGNIFYSVSVDLTKTKMLLTGSVGTTYYLYYATCNTSNWILDNGIWGPTTQPTWTIIGSLTSNTQIMGVQLSSNGNYGVITKAPSQYGIIDWTGTTPILTNYSLSNVTSCAISPDGNTVILGTTTNGIYYCKNTAWQTPVKTLVSGTIIQGMSLSPDSSIIIYSTSNYLYYSIWNGTNYAAGINTNFRCVPYSMTFIGGGYSSSPTYILVKNSSILSLPVSNAVYLIPWNNVNKTLGIPVQISSSIFNTIASTYYCNNCSDGVTYYYAENDANIYYTVIYGM